MKETAIKAAREAGMLLRAHHGKVKKIIAKSKTSLVTDVDLASDALIKKIIRLKYPLHNIVSEETPPLDKKSDYTWYIDPIDGTHNYAKGLPIFGVSIGLAYKGELIVGVINEPMMGNFYVAEKGRGAFCNNQKISVSKKATPAFALVVYDFGHTAREKSMACIKKAAPYTVDVRNFGCAVYALSSVAQGNAEGYIIHKTNSWDVAAGFLLITEAGGRVTNHEGTPYNLTGERAFVASNGKLHNFFLSLL